MIGLVLVTHGRLADEFVAAMQHVVGPQEQIRAISIAADDDIELRRQDIVEAVEATDTGQGVIILTDMFGGTPSNLAISTLERPGLEVIAGVNLPMLIKLAGVRAMATSRRRSPRRRMPARNTSTWRAGCSRRSGMEPLERAGPARAAATPCAARCTIVNSRGLHARAAAKFVRLAATFDADVEVERDGARVPATSIWG